MVLTGIVAVTVGLPLASAFATGAIDIPHNDDWAYSRIALDLAESGELRLVGWNQMSLIGHLVWALPFLALFGESLQVLHVAQAVAAAAGIVLSYLVVRRFLRTSLALVATALLAVFPGYALLSTTYMTDTTAFAAQLACLWLGLIAVDRARFADPLLVGSIGVGLFAYTIREAALAAPLAVLTGRLAAGGGPRARRHTVALLLLVLSFAAAFFAWRHTLPGDESPWTLGSLPPYERVEPLVRAFFTSAFAALPALLLTLRSGFARNVSIWSGVTGLGAAALGAVTIVRGGPGPQTLFLGNSLTRVGAVADTLFGRPVLFPAWAWGAMTLAALAAGILLAMLLAASVERVLRTRPVRRAPAISPRAVVGGAYAMLTVALLVVRSSSGGALLFDRYLWGIQLFLLVLLLSPVSAARRPQRWAALACAAALAVISLVIVLEEHTSSVARWSAGQASVAAGAPARTVDAGFEWMGWHYDGVVGSFAGEPRWRRPASWYNVLKFPDLANCTVMAYAPRREPWLETVQVRSYRAFGLWGRRQVYVYRNRPAC
jgi:hypothetical protein